MKWRPVWRFVLIVVLAWVALGALDRFTSFDLLGASEPPPALTPDWEAQAEARVWERTTPSKPQATPTPSPTHTPTPVPQSPVASYRLEVTASPDALGSVQVSPSGDNGLYAAGATVVITASCTTELVGWTGDLSNGQSASANILTVTMDRDRTLIAGCAEPTSSPTATPVPSPTATPAPKPTAIPTPVPVWVALADTPEGVRGGAAFASDGTDIFALQGGRERGFWMFDIDEGSWDVLAKAPRALENGGSLVSAGGYIYALRGGTSRDFWRHDVAGGAWEIRARTPATVGWGSSLVWDGSLTWDGSDTIYALRGALRDNFWMYSLSGDTWTRLARTPEGVYGGSLVSAGGSIYAFRGGNSQDFWRYDVADEAWEIRARTPASIGWGGSLAWDGSDTIYALRGALKDDFWMYSLSGGTWTPLARTPRSVYQGGALVFVAGDVYGLRGDDTVDFWRYDLGTVTSSTVADDPTPVVKGGAPCSFADGVIYALRGGVTAVGFCSA